MRKWSTEYLQTANQEKDHNLRHTDDTTLRAESEELKSFLMKVKEESEKVDLNVNIKKTKIMTSSPMLLHGK